MVAFHLGWIDGGYLGVDAFFVLSGFLITSLLVGEHSATGTIGLRRFWTRRARRLLPAMLVVVGVVLLWAMVSAPGELATVRGDAVATLLYVANWHEIATSANYWTIFQAPSPLQHAWSLAIEEQFYLVWPLLVLAVAALAARLRRPLAGVLGPVAIALAAASYLLMALLYRADDVSRAYFGTETRVGAIALGAALATLLRRWHGPRTAAGRAALDGAGAVALGGLAVAWVVLAGTTPWLYRGGFVLLGPGGRRRDRCRGAAGQPPGPGGVVAAAARPRTHQLRALPVALGRDRHADPPAHAAWTASRSTPSSWRSAWRAALLSYWCLEQPIRQRRWLRSPSAALPAAVGAYTSVFALVAVSTLVPPPSLGGLANALQSRAARQDAVAASPPSTAAGAAAAGAPAAGASAAASTPTQPPVTTAPPTTVAPLPPARIGVFGDSTAHPIRHGARRLRQANRGVHGARQRRASGLRHRPGRRAPVRGQGVRAEHVLRRPVPGVVGRGGGPPDRRRRAPNRDLGGRRAQDPGRRGSGGRSATR